MVSDILLDYLVKEEAEDKKEDKKKNKENKDDDDDAKNVGPAHKKVKLEN